MRCQAGGVLQLQCGRAHVSAETSAATLEKDFRSDRLQCGRAHVSAETTLADWSDIAGQINASMWPRSRERGNADMPLPRSGANFA